MLEAIKQFILNKLFLLKIMFSTFFRLKVLGNKPVLKDPNRKSIDVRASRRKLRALEASFRKAGEDFSHSNYLNMLALRAIINSNLSKTKEFNQSVDEIIKVCLDWKARYKESSTDE